MFKITVLKFVKPLHYTIEGTVNLMLIESKENMYRVLQYVLCALIPVA